jgi:hypothetical protein
MKRDLPRGGAGIIDEVIQTKKSNLPKPARPVLV